MVHMFEENRKTGELQLFLGFLSSTISWQFLFMFEQKQRTQRNLFVNPTISWASLDPLRGLTFHVLPSSAELPWLGPTLGWTSEDWFERVWLTHFCIPVRNSH